MKNQILKNRLSVISITALVFLFHAETIKAQITFGEVKEPPKEIPDWERYGRKELCAPYDSTSLNVNPLPLIDAYKKYVGQQLFLLDVASYENIVYENLIYSTKTFQQKLDYSGYNLDERERAEIGLFTKTDVYCPICKYNPEGYKPECKNEVNKIINKYYNVIDVIDAKKFNPEYYKYINSSSKFYPSESLRLKYIDNKGENKSEDVHIVTPHFVMVEKQSGDTVYTLTPDKFIIVGAFVKMQQEWIGKTYIESRWVIPIKYKDVPKNDLMNICRIRGWDNFYPTIEKITKWKCINVTFVKKELSCIFQDTENPTIEKSVIMESFQTFNSYLTSVKKLKEIENEQIVSIISKETSFPISENVLNEYVNYRDSLMKVKDEEKLLAQKKEKDELLKEEQKSLEYNKQREAEKVQRKQMLINKYGQTMGTKVYNQEPEIGMTKAMFDDMNLKFRIVSTQKSETANGMVEVFVIRFGLNTCKRIVIINQKIKQIDTYNCN